MSVLNDKLLKEFSDETGLEPTYRKGASTYHSLKYVNWLEEKITADNSKNTPCETCTDDNCDKCANCCPHCDKQLN